jgi:flagellar motor switch protein FliM
LAETTITVGELLSLQPGDIIQTAKPANSELLVRVEGKNKYRALLGRYKENKAMRITRNAAEDERM